MSQAVTIDTKTVKDLLSTLHELKKQIASLNEKLAEAPPYGSDEWWAWSDRKALEDIKQGRVRKFDSAKAAIKWLKS